MTGPAPSPVLVPKAPGVGMLSLPPRMGVAGVRLVDTPCPSQIRRIDVGCLPMVDAMHRNGVLVDKAHFAHLEGLLGERLREIELDIDALVGSEYPGMNPASADQVAHLLFVRLGLTPPGEARRTGGGKRLSTEDEVLSGMVKMHPVIGSILDHREISKLMGTYVIPMPKMVSADGRLRTVFKPTRTRTGRLACGDRNQKKPNLQNVPTRGDWGGMVRDGFRAGPGNLLVSLDLSQIEMRLAAHMSGDPTMVRVFILGQDIHTQTAIKMFRLVPEEVLGLLEAEAAGTLTEAQAKALKGFKHTYRLPAKCFHPDTEVLTRTGWKRIPDLGAGEEVAQALPKEGGHTELEWVVPNEVFTTQHPSGQLVHLKNQGMDLRVTPDHRMLGFTKAGTPKVILAHAFAEDKSIEYWPNAGVLSKGAETRVGETLLRLAVATQADGSVTPTGAIKFGFTKARKISRLTVLLEKAGINGHESVVHNGKNGYSFTFSIHKADAERILRYLDLDKTLPWWWLDLTPELRVVVLDEAEYWDSCKIERRFMYSSRVRKNVDVLQALASITERKSRTTTTPEGDHVLVVRRDKFRSRTGNLDSETQPYTGEVACLSVPSGFVLVRDGGVPVICGQTLGFALLYGVSARGLQLQIVSAGGPLLEVEECQRYIEDWFGVYPLVLAYLQLQYERVRRYGMNWTGFGRVRLIPECKCVSRKKQGEGDREAGNHPIQGTAADMLKLMMAEIWPVCHYYESLGVTCMPLLQVHDELIFEVTAKWAREFAEWGREIMRTAVELLVPVDSSADMAERWGQLK